MTGPTGAVDGQFAAAVSRVPGLSTADFRRGPSGEPWFARKEWQDWAENHPWAPAAREQLRGPMGGTIKAALGREGDEAAFPKGGGTRPLAIR